MTHVNIRLAKNDDGPAVDALMKKDDSFQWEGWEIDWSELEPHWLVAEIDGEIVGTIQVIPAKPIGRMEILTVDPGLCDMSRGRVVKMLTDHAIATNKMYGSQAVMSSIPYELEEYFNHAQNRGWMDISQGYIIIRGLG